MSVQFNLVTVLYTYLKIYSNSLQQQS